MNVSENIEVEQLWGTMPVICVDCRYIGTRPSGIGEMVQALVDHLPSLAPDLEFLLIRNRSHVHPLSNATNVRETVTGSPANGPATMWWLSRIVDLAGIDLFHAPSNILPKGLTVPTVTTVHDIMWLESPDLCGSGLRWHVERAFFAHGIARALATSSAITTVSHASSAAIAAWSSAAGARTHVTPSGVASDFHRVATNAERLHQLGIPLGKGFVLTVGQYAPYKNHEGAIRAFAQAFNDRLDIDLVLVQRMGRGAEALLNLAERLGIGGRVHLLRSISRQDLVLLYSSAKLLLHPSFCEGFGNPLVEAMACGCPVITSNISAMPEVTGAAAIHVDPHNIEAIADALVQLIDDQGAQSRLQELGLAKAREFSWVRFAQQTLAVYRQVLARRAG